MDFLPGLNVVLGPNVAGKSTVFKALRHALLFKTSLTKPQKLKFLDPYLPAGGVLADGAAIQARVAELLPAKPATVEMILLVGQAELGATVDALRGGSREATESMAELADILRRAVLESGGVSVDRFMDRLNDLCGQARSKWDAAQGAPERDAAGRSRGIENPWKNACATSSRLVGHRRVSTSAP